MKFNKLACLAFLGLLGVFLFVPKAILAVQLETLPDVADYGDFVVGPGKSELFLAPGESVVKNLMVTNRYAGDMSFKLEIEDFAGSKKAGENITLLGTEKGPYSLKDFLHPEVMQFTLKHGQRIVVPIKVEIPKDAQPGGLYGTVIVTTEPMVNAAGSVEGQAQGKVTVISRLASLFFVRVKGEVKEEGKLNLFSLNQTFFDKPQVGFKLDYENTGSIYLNPYGVIKISNLLGNTIDEVKIDPFFVMPDGLREKELNYQRSFMFGRYQATLQLNRGYNNLVDERTVYFWVLPWKVIAIVLVGAGLLVSLLLWLAKWFKKNFEIRRKE